MAPELLQVLKDGKKKATRDASLDLSDNDLLHMHEAMLATRVCPGMLPPTIIEAPTSETTPPNPAITAASRGSRASLARSQYVCTREAPSPSNWSLSPGFKF